MLVYQIARAEGLRRSSNKNFNSYAIVRFMLRVKAWQDYRIRMERGVLSSLTIDSYHRVKPHSLNIGYLFSRPSKSEGSLAATSSYNPRHIVYHP